MSWKLKREAGEFCFINRMIDTQTFVQALEQEKSFEWKKKKTKPVYKNPKLNEFHKFNISRQSEPKGS
jgi:hypothetical protein